MFKVNKLKLLVSLIIVEILTIMILVGFIVFDSGIGFSRSEVFNFTQSSLIYSTDDQSKPFTGRMQDTLSNKVIIEFDVVDGFKDGEYMILTLDGNYAVEGFMKKNKNHGEWKYYYDNGELECTGSFLNDLPSGKWKWFYISGELKCEGNFINGKEEGMWMQYDKDGSLNHFVNYRAGEVITYINTNLFKKV